MGRYLKHRMLMVLCHNYKYVNTYGENNVKKDRMKC